MYLDLLLRGCILGFSIAAPVGPIGVLCIRRTLTEGRRSAFISGLGAATADALYGCIAGFGLTFVSSVLLGQHLWLRLIGGVYLCYLGLRTCLSAPAADSAGVAPGSLAAAYISTFLLTITNPLTILAFLAIFAGMGIATTARDYSAASMLVLGVFTGSALWWLLLSSGVSLFRARLNLHRLWWVNQLSGAIIIGFGIVALLGVGS